MKKILNWTFSGFFRTLGRFILYILIGYFVMYLVSKSDIKLPSLFNVLDVYADTIQFYSGSPNGMTAEEIAINNTYFLTNRQYTGLGRGAVYNCSSNDTCNGSITYYTEPSVLVWRGTMANYGFDFTHDNTIYIAQNHLYSYIFTFCTSAAINSYTPRIFIGNSLNNQRYNEQTILRYSYYAESNIEWLHYENSGANVVDTTNCYTTYNLFNYVNGNAINIKVNLKTSSLTNSWIGILGYRLEDLGSTSQITTNQIQNIITNSGLATANSIEEVQDSMDAMNDSIDAQTQQQQQNHEELMDTITDDTINDDGIDDMIDGLSGNTSSLTPFSDFINLPLSWIQSLLASNQSCETIHLPLPYLNNKYLDLPCMTDFWDRMGAVATLVQVVWIAIVGVRIFNGLFLLTCDVLDPNPDKDMTKLRTWEL